MPTLDRPKQENFAQYFVETGNASEAYRKAYKTDGMKPETVHHKAKELMDNGKITARIEELQAEHRERHKLTVDDLLDELEVAREKALERGQLSVAVSATMGKAKILGFDKQLHEVKADLRELPSKINIIFTDEPEPQITG